MQRIPQSIFLALLVAQTHLRTALTWKEVSSSAGHFKAAYLADPSKIAQPIEMLRVTYHLGSWCFHLIASLTPTADFIERTWFPGYQKSLAKTLRETAPANNAAAVNRSRELFAAKVCDTFKLIHTTSAPSNSPSHHNRIEVRSVLADPKEKPVAAKKLEPCAVLEQIAPNYPPEAKAAGITSKVEVQIAICEKDKVIETIAISGPESLREVTERAAKQRVFEPAKVDRRPVKVEELLTFNFTLQTEGRPQ